MWIYQIFLKMNPASQSILYQMICTPRPLIYGRNREMLYHLQSCRIPLLCFSHCWHCPQSLQHPIILYSRSSLPGSLLCSHEPNKSIHQNHYYSPYFMFKALDDLYQPLTLWLSSLPPIFKLSPSNNNLWLHKTLSNSHFLTKRKFHDSF